MSQELLDSAIELLPRSRLRAFVEARSPSTKILRRGVFGEVLAVRLLEEVHNHVVPIKKLRYRTASHDSPKATDVLAIKLDGSRAITSVAYVEAKFRSTRSRLGSLALDAHEQIRKDCSDEVPGIIAFAAQVLKERNDPLFESVMAYLRDRELLTIDTHHIFLIVDKSCWRDTDLDVLREHDTLLEPLDVHVVTIDSLCDTTDLVYQAVGYQTMPDED